MGHGSQPPACYQGTGPVLQICRWSRSHPPGARRDQLPAFTIMGVSISQPNTHKFCQPLLRGSLLSTISGDWEKFPPSHCKPRGCDLVSCSLQDLRQAVSWWCFGLWQQPGDRNRQEPTSHGKTGPKVLHAVVGQVFFVLICFFSHALVQRLKHVDRDFVAADGVYIGLSLPCGKALASLWQSSLRKGTCFVLAMLHNRRTYFGAIKAFSCILKHSPFFTWVTTIKENNITYLSLN